MQTRIYLVAEPEGDRLIEAINASAAVRFCARQRYHAEIAKPRTIARLMANGVRVEQATGEQEASK